MVGEKHNRNALQPPELERKCENSFLTEDILPSPAFPPRLSAMINTENIAAGMSALRYLSFGFAPWVLFVKGKWDHKSALQGAKGRDDRIFQQVARKEVMPRTGFPWKEMPARILPRYTPCIVATAKSISLFLAGELIHSSLHR